MYTGALTDDIEAEAHIQPIAYVHVALVAGGIGAVVLAIDTIVVALVVEHDIRVELLALCAHGHIVLLQYTGSEGGILPLAAVVVGAPLRHLRVVGVIADLAELVAQHQTRGLGERAGVGLIGA